jgi:hypothetical protein
MGEDRELLCPSARSSDADGTVFGVITGSVDAPEVHYLRRSLPLVEVRHLAAPVEPGEVFRTAAPCATSGCVHFRDARCGLVDRLVDGIPEGPAQGLRPCAVRRDCRWWHQRGPDACARCAHVVTVDYRPTPALAEAARPVAP